MEIYKKKYPIEFAISLFYSLTIFGMSAFALSLPLFVEERWPINVMIIVVSGAFCVLFFILAVDFCAEYKHLVIDKKPVIVINDDSITYYAHFSRKYVTFKFEDIKEFKLIVTRGGSFIQPEFKNPELAKKYRYRSYWMQYSIVAKYDNFEDGYSNIIYILNHILGCTYFENIYKSVKERKI